MDYAASKNRIIQEFQQNNIQELLRDSNFCQIHFLAETLENGSRIYIFLPGYKTNLPQKNSIIE